MAHFKANYYCVIPGITQMIVKKMNFWVLKKRIRKIIPSCIISIYHFLWAFLSALFFGFPSKKIKVIGVTGTNGKSSTISLISQIFRQAGYKIAILSSLGTEINGKSQNKERMTMPGRFAIQKFLRESVKQKCDYAILEITSEGILQYRHRFIDFEIAVFTNLSPEHIESHGSFENYRKAKTDFFRRVKNIHILNLDDENIRYFRQFPAKEKYGYQIVSSPTNQIKQKNNLKIITARDINIKPNSCSFIIDNIVFKIPLIGKFNIYNSLAAICASLSQGIQLKKCKQALEKAQNIPGRMEIVISKPITVFVDYAFTPNALTQVYETLKKNWADKKLICVLGSCGGGRDKWKRPVLGKIASDNCDKIILTNEDPFDENPETIINQIASGVTKQEKVNKILDRRIAIKTAIQYAQEKDVVIITGKGCEQSICLAKGNKMPWDDRKVVREEFQKIFKKQYV